MADLHPDAGVVRGVAAPGVPPRAGRGRRHAVHDPPGEGPRVGPRRGVRGHRRDRAPPAGRGRRGGAPRAPRRHHPRPPPGARARRPEPPVARAWPSSTAPRRTAQPVARRRGGRASAGSRARRRRGRARRSRPRSASGSGARRLRGRRRRARATTGSAWPSTAAAPSPCASASGSRSTARPAPSRRPPSPVAERGQRRAAGLAGASARRPTRCRPTSSCTTSTSTASPSATRPTSRSLRACPGIGPAKLEAYGDEILGVLAGVTDGAAVGTGSVIRAAPHRSDHPYARAGPAPAPTRHQRETPWPSSTAPCGPHRSATWSGSRPTSGTGRPCRTRTAAALTRHDVVDHLQVTDAAPSSGPLRVGIEQEWHTYSPGRARPPPAAPRRSLAAVEAGRDRCPCGSRVTIEPGGQVELATRAARALARRARRAAGRRRRACASRWPWPASRCSAPASTRSGSRCARCASRATTRWRRTSTGTGPPAAG